jgi:hypothetical protein
VNNIFKGGFYGFGSIGFSEFWLGELMPNIDKDRLFVWLFNRVPYDTSRLKQDSVYRVSGNIGLIASTAAQQYDSLNFAVGMPIYFVIDSTLYETEILEFLFTDYDNDSARIYASCQIPDALKSSHRDLYFFHPICSTSKSMVPYNNFPGYASRVDEMRQFGQYTIHRHMEDTGKLGDWGEKIFIAWVEVIFDSTDIYRTGTSAAPIACSYGDFNGNGKLDIYLQYYRDSTALHEYFIEFDGAAYQTKEYVTELYD